MGFRELLSRDHCKIRGGGLVLRIFNASVPGTIYSLFPVWQMNYSKTVLTIRYSLARLCFLKHSMYNNKTAIEENYHIELLLFLEYVPPSPKSIAFVFLFIVSFLFV